MKQIEKKKFVTVGMMIVMIVSMLSYPIAASDSTNTSRLKANQGDIFTAKIPNDDKEVDCTFKILTLPSGNTPGTVQIAKGVYQGYYIPAIAKSTTGTIDIPDTVNYDGNSYIVTTIGSGAFYECTGLTSTGLEKSNKITKVKDHAYFECTGLTSTGIEKNTVITTLEDYLFSGCTGLKSTGLAENKTITSIGVGTFFGCTGLTSTGLEENTTVTSVGERAFQRCSSLSKLVFNILTLPTMNGDVFEDINVDIYYLPETTNPNVLTSVGLAATKMNVENIEIHTPPTKTTYIEEETFDLSGLVLDVTYSNLGTVQRNYDDIDYQVHFAYDKRKATLQDSAIDITYLGQNSVSQAITVSKKPITDIEIKTAPTKVNYIEEEDFDATGLIITVKYIDGTSEDITYNNSTKDNFSFKSKVKLEDKHIVITYGGKTTTQAITVKEKSIINIKIKTEPNKVEYVEGEIFNPEGLVVEAVYNNEINEDVLYNENTKEEFIFDKSKLRKEDQSIKITYLGQSVELAIKVEVKGNQILEEKTINTSDTMETAPYIALGTMALLGFLGIIRYRK